MSQHFTAVFVIVLLLGGIGVAACRRPVRCKSRSHTQQTPTEGQAIGHAFLVVEYDKEARPAEEIKDLDALRPP